MIIGGDLIRFELFHFDAVVSFCLSSFVVSCACPACDLQACKQQACNVVVAQFVLLTVWREDFGIIYPLDTYPKDASSHSYIYRGGAVVYPTYGRTTIYSEYHTVSYLQDDIETAVHCYFIMSECSMFSSNIQ